MINITTDAHITLSCLYGITGATTMVLQSMQDNSKVEISITDCSLVERYGSYYFAYKSSLPLNTSEIIDNVTYFNILPGKYTYQFFSGEDLLDANGIFYLNNDVKNNTITYETTSQSKIYQG